MYRHVVMTDKSSPAYVAHVRAWPLEDRHVMLGFLMPIPWFLGWKQTPAAALSAPRWLDDYLIKKWLEFCHQFLFGKHFKFLLVLFPLLWRWITFGRIFSFRLVFGGFELFREFVIFRRLGQIDIFLANWFDCLSGWDGFLNFIQAKVLVVGSGGCHFSPIVGFQGWRDSFNQLISRGSRHLLVEWEKIWCAIHSSSTYLA